MFKVIIFNTHFPKISVTIHFFLLLIALEKQDTKAFFYLLLRKLQSYSYITSGLKMVNYDFY